ncbi:MAG: DUF1254 domain-containing protein [Acidiferrobacteraceae bacterium]|nr:DUF1254 domain-containing protein [Acidiferrobacteraceae bacterium]
MKLSSRRYLLIGFFLFVCVNHNTFAEKPKYAADVPDALITPDLVQTDYLGELKFFDGMPNDLTVQKAYDFLDTYRAVESFLSGMPAASIYALLEGHRGIGMQPNDIGITENLMDARSLWLTPQTTTPYVHAEIDVKNGPVVIENPGAVLGFIDDAFFLYVTDIGLAGPDQGKPFKYLLVGPDFAGEIPDGYHVVRTNTYRNLFIVRLFVADGDVAGTVDAFKKSIRIYPLAQADNPPEQRFFNLSGRQYNTIHASDKTFYDELNAVIQYEPANAFNPELVGLFASIGIKKGKPFAPDKRMQKILTEGAAIATTVARSIMYRPRSESVYFYPGERRWYSPLAGGSSEFLDNGERVLADRVFFHYYATGITPAMAKPKVGTGSVYAMAADDAKGRYLDGGKTYSVTLPGPVPAQNFWSFMVYSGQTRSILETDQKTGGVDSNSPNLKANDDGSFTVWFGPKAPAGKEGNWVQTEPNTSYSCLLRLYSPLEPWFDKTWKPGDFELLN